MFESETVWNLELESVPASLLIFEFWSVAGAVVFDDSDGCCVDGCVDDIDDGDCGWGGSDGDDDDTGNDDISSISLSAISSIWSIDLSDLIDLIDNDRVTLDGVSSICVGCIVSISFFTLEFVNMISDGVLWLPLELTLVLVLVLMLVALLDVTVVILLMTDTIEPPVDSSTTVSATGNR